MIHQVRKNSPSPQIIPHVSANALILSFIFMSSVIRIGLNRVAIKNPASVAMVWNPWIIEVAQNNQAIAKGSPPVRGLRPPPSN
jgi:hypothetical protein